MSEPLKRAETIGPVILWQDYGTEGWKPTSFATLKEALAHNRYGVDWILTRKIDYEVTERFT